MLAVLIGTVVALPLALLARRSRLLAGPVLGLSTVVYTIPSLALFALLFPFTGLSSTTVLIGLVAYSLVILLRNILAGLVAVPGRRAGGGPRHGVRAGADARVGGAAAGAADVHGGPAHRHGLARSR